MALICAVWAIGKAQAELWEEAYADEGCVLLAPNVRNVKKQAVIFANWCEEEKIDIVIGNQLRGNIILIAAFTGEDSCNVALCKCI